MVHRAKLELKDLQVLKELQVPRVLLAHKETWVRRVQLEPKVRKEQLVLKVLLDLLLVPLIKLFIKTEQMLQQVAQT